MPRAQVERAAREVGAHPMITALDGRYLHQVTAGGRNLSTGQCSCSHWPGARLVDPILLLDGGHRGRIPATEAVVRQATLTWQPDRTTAVVAHGGLAIAEHADHVSCSSTLRWPRTAPTELLTGTGATEFAANGRPILGYCSPEITQLQCIDA